MTGRIVGADLRVRPGSKYHEEHEEKTYKSRVFGFFMLFMVIDNPERRSIQAEIDRLLPEHGIPIYQ